MLGHVLFLVELVLRADFGTAILILLRPTKLISLIIQIKLFHLWTVDNGACSSVALAGFALPKCPGSSSRVYSVLEGLAAVVHHGLVPSPLPGSTLYVYVCHPCGALPAPGLAGCPVGRGE